MSSFQFARIFMVAPAGEARAAPAPVGREPHAHAVWIPSRRVLLNEEACKYNESNPSQVTRFCGVVIMPAEEERTPLESLLVRCGATSCMFCESSPPLQPRVAATLAAALCLSPSLSVRVGAAYALCRHAMLAGEPGTLMRQLAVIDALSAAVSDFDFERADVPTTPEMTSELLQARGGEDTLHAHTWSHAELAEFTRELDVAPGLGASDVLALAKVQIKLICLATLSALLDQVESASPDQLALAAALQSRGVFADVCTLGSAQRWTANGTLIPPVAAKLCADLGLTLASDFLERMAVCARRGMARGGVVIQKALAVALSNGSNVCSGDPIERRQRARGTAATLLSYIVIDLPDIKQQAVRDGALVWLLSVAEADGVYCEFVLGRAIAGAGNIARAARHAAELEPLTKHVLDVISALLHSHNPTVMVHRISYVRSSPLYCATFVVGQLAAIEDVRPLLQEADAQGLITQLLARAQCTPKLQEIARLISSQVQLLMSQPPLVRLQRADMSSSATSIGAAATAARGGASPAGLFATPSSDAPSPPPAQQQQRKCDGCGAVVASRAFKLCAGCKSVRYCGAECQARAWPQHKKACKARGRSGN